MLLQYVVAWVFWVSFLECCYSKTRFFFTCFFRTLFTLCGC